MLSKGKSTGTPIIWEAKPNGGKSSSEKITSTPNKTWANWVLSDTSVETETMMANIRNKTLITNATIENFDDVITILIKVYRN